MKETSMYNAARHATAKRLATVAKAVGGAERPSEVARLLNVSEQRINNWMSRGVSKEGMLLAQRVLGCNATWLADGSGEMLASGADAKRQSSPNRAKPGKNTHPASNNDQDSATVSQTIPLRYSVDSRNVRHVYVVGRAQGGLPERIWTDGDYPVGATDEYADLATTDPHAFLTPVMGTSMVPRFRPGEFAFVEPGTEPEAGDDVLVRLATGETMIKNLHSLRGGMIELWSYNNQEQGPLFFRREEISWMYYVANPVPARKIKSRM